MKRATMLTLTTMLALALLTVAAGAERFWNDRGYDQRPNYQGDFTNSEAWSATVVDVWSESFVVVRYGERITVRFVQGRPRLFIGQRVRLVPFRRDGGAEIAELRLPDIGFEPVATVRYFERAVPKEGPYYYGPRVGFRAGYSRGGWYEPGLSFDFRIEKGRPQRGGRDNWRQPEPRRGRYNAPRGGGYWSW